MGSNLVTLYKKPDKGLNHKEVLKNFKTCDYFEVYWLWTTKFQEKVRIDLRFIKGSCSISDLLKTNPANAVFTSLLVVVFKISWIDQRHTVVSGQVLGENIEKLSSQQVKTDYVKNVKVRSLVCCSYQVSCITSVTTPYDLHI